jgi:aspartokinase
VGVEVEIRDNLVDWALAPGAAADKPTILLVFDTASGELVAVAAHERQFLGTSALDKVAATKIHLAAVAKKWQGKAFSSGERVSHVVMNAVLTDIATHVPPRDPRVFAIVHENNHKSRALCKRFRLVKELLRSDPRYLVLATEHQVAK